MMIVRSSIGSSSSFLGKVQRSTAGSVRRHALVGNRGSLGHETTFHQFLSGTDELVGFNGLRLHPGSETSQTVFQRYQGLKRELGSYGCQVRKAMANIPQTVLAGHEIRYLAPKILAQ